MAAGLRVLIGGMPLVLSLFTIVGALKNPGSLCASNVDWGDKVFGEGPHTLYINFSDPGLQMGMRSINLHGNRYPGGNPSNCFDLQSGRLSGADRFCNRYKRKETLMGKMPEGAYAGSSFSDVITTPAPPVWVFNVLSATVEEIEAQAQYLATLPQHQVEVVELGNEFYLGDYAFRFPTPSSYFALLDQIVPKIRKALPRVKIAIVGDWKALVELHGWGATKRDKAFLNATAKFLGTPSGKEVDYFVCHDYSLHGKALEATPETDWPTALGAWGDSIFQKGVIAYHSMGLKAELLFTEFGVPYAQDQEGAAWQFVVDQMGGLLEAMHWLSYLFGAVKSQSGGMSVAGMYRHPLLEWMPYSRELVGSRPQPCNGKKTSPLLCFNETMASAPFCSITSQIFAHVASIAGSSTGAAYIDLHSPPSPTRIAGQIVPCMVSLKFQPEGQEVVMNRCSTPLHHPSGGRSATYALSDQPGERWARCPSGGSLPWSAPFNPKVGANSGLIPAHSITIITHE